MHSRLWLNKSNTRLQQSVRQTKSVPSKVTVFLTRKQCPGKQKEGISYWQLHRTLCAQSRDAPIQLCLFWFRCLNSGHLIQICVPHGIELFGNMLMWGNMRPGMLWHLKLSKWPTMTEQVLLIAETMNHDTDKETVFNVDQWHLADTQST